MTNIHSNVTELPHSCKSVADHMAKALAKEDAFATLTTNNLQKITELEHTISHDSGENVALVAYRV